MQKVIVNRLKLKCSKGRIERGETVILSEAEIAKIISSRPDAITVLEAIKEPAKKAPIKSKPKRARNSNGTLKADNPNTPNINEAWENE
jgi:hypothetical protein|tara:strand:- start:12426 stop:12692 length:267 start_codon:yes stop_codon:yes gene_type:complete